MRIIWNFQDENQVEDFKLKDEFSVHIQLEFNLKRYRYFLDHNWASGKYTQTVLSGILQLEINLNALST